ncbi:golgin subfamily A member 2 [Periplaneta americana]|uniref:golgin subfamily A member 2 n=1 Tax=Periplaneta americana TaxID=6978 RepID=UPI0037E8AEC0
MADMAKAEKLAAARKKLKEYQQKSKDIQPSGNRISGKKNISKPQIEAVEGSLKQNSVFDSGPRNADYKETSGSVTSESSTNSAVQGDFKISNTPPEFNTYHTESNEKLSGSEINNFAGVQNGEVKSIDENQFRGLNDVFNFESMSTVTPSNSAASGNSIPSYTASSDIVAARNFFDNFSFNKDSQSSSDNVDTTLGANESQDTRTVQQLFSTESVSASSYEHVCASGESQTSLSFSLEDSNSSRSVIVKNPDATDSQDSIQVIDSKTDQAVANNESEVTQQEAMAQKEVSEPLISFRSSSESLRQLSLQINGLIQESVQESVPHAGDSALEQRNQELAALLAAETQKSEQLQLHLKEYQSRVSELQLDLDQMRTESEARVTREVGLVQEQLQLHVQTVGILVGEKTELQAALTKSQNLAKQKAGEAEELQGRLKASRHKVMDLEKTVSSTQETTQKLEKLTHELSAELEKQKVELMKTKKHLGEAEEEVSELRQKLDAKTNDFVKLQLELEEKSSQLSLTQVRVQQLMTTDTSEVDGQLETLHQQNLSLEKQVTELQQTVKSVGAERDQASQQYQQYVQQLNGQLQSLASKIEALNSENEQLAAREQSLVRHVSDLEKQLQQQQNQKRRDTPPKPLQQDSPRLSELEEKLKLVEGEKQTLTEQLESQVQENQNIQRELEDRHLRIEELESMLEQLEGEQPDKDKLLAAMESDKVAAARAVGQNQRLKQQLEELQEGFVKMSNNKLELTEQLQHEQHVCKEQSETLAQQEQELTALRSELLEKEQLLQQYSNQMLQQNQVAEFVSHEAHGQLNELLQQELEQAKEHNQALSTQNRELRTLLAQQRIHDPGSSSGAVSLDDASIRKDETLATLSASVKQLQEERDQLLEKLKQQEQQNSVQEDSSAPEVFSKKTNEEEIPKDYESMKVAMEQLEERFTKTMKEVADLTDEKQRLEHLVLQLQGETETIGEYIALYQVQRSILRQRAQEKDEQLSKLAKDREDMRKKLGELNNLVRQLVAEKESNRKKSITNPLQNLTQISINHSPEVEEGIPNGEIVEIEEAIEAKTDANITSPAEDSNSPALEGDTAVKIMALISEIGTSSLVDPQCSENFHPCPWCSGRLITV